MTFFFFFSDISIYIYKQLQTTANNCVINTDSKSAQYECRAHYKYLEKSKTNTSKQLLVACLHIHQGYNMRDVKHKFHLIYSHYK